MPGTNEFCKTLVFVLVVLLLPLLGVYVLAGMIDFGASSPELAVLWLAGFGVLTLNNSHMLVCSVVALWPKDKPIPETEHSSGKCIDVLYVVRNENTDLLYRTMAGSLSGISGTNARVWLLSNSDSRDSKLSERQLIQSLQERFGTKALSMFDSSRNPLRRKHVCIQEWLEVHPESSYIIICDADTVLPPGSVQKLVRKAEHPNNAGICLFQSHLRVVEVETRFARLLSFGQEIAQRLYTTAHQRVLGRSAYYGSGCLIRADAYRHAKAPAWVLSHDIWETVALEQNAGRIVYCSDVVTFGGFPPNMLEFLRRNRRWILGTMEAIPLIGSRGIPLGTRFLVLLPIYLYLVQPVFLIWMVFGFVLSLSTRASLMAQTFAAAGSGYVHLEMSSCLLFTMVIVVGHRFTQGRGLKEIGLIALELTASIILCLNCILLDSITVVATLIHRRKGREWVRSEKQNRPLTLRDIAHELWPCTLFGVIATAAGVIYASNWALIASPFLASFCLGIPAASWTARKTGGSPIVLI